MYTPYKTKIQSELPLTGLKIPPQKNFIYLRARAVMPDVK